MGQKVNPIGFRLPIRRDWVSRWYGSKQNYPLWLKEDFDIRQFLKTALKYASISKIFIERAGGRIRVKIYTPRPGLVVGRRGHDLDTLSGKLQKMVGHPVLIDIQEVKRPELVAKLVAENVAQQLERRISFRRATKKAVQVTMGAGAQGVKLQCSGRLGGADIARTEVQRVGRVPLHTLREDIDYALVEADTVYGKIGVKCWICRPKERESQAR
ncbi:MAG: 30S ribosomal protein S3 [Puniceicoccales bacterium]|jgi:small subunit ribosomal protein S3|nr:30S ribosomal protein S3 [Puniceicoccales bacterium]